MVEIRTYKLAAILTCLVLTLAACGSNAQNQSMIATAVAQTQQNQSIIGTAVAQTVEAQSGPQIVVASTNTPVGPLTIEATLTPAITPTEEPTLVSAPSDPDCIHASLTSEYPPDATIYKPGDVFTKTWTIKNLGNCTWDKSYKLIFWSGDLMGGSTYYDLPEVVLPGDDIAISIILKAPATDGNYTGYWRLQTPWNKSFGVGEYSQAFYANIAVFKKPGPHFEITSVTYEVVRDPLTGCPVNVRNTVYITVTTNGPYDFRYYLDQSDGNESAIKTMSFSEAGSKTISRLWMIGRGDSPNPRWMEFVETVPETLYYKYYGRVFIYNTCP